MIESLIRNPRLIVGSRSKKAKRAWRRYVERGKENLTSGDDGRYALPPPSKLVWSIRDDSGNHQARLFR